MLRYLANRFRHAVWVPLILLTVVSLAPPRISASLGLTRGPAAPRPFAGPGLARSRSQVARLRLCRRRERGGPRGFAPAACCAGPLTRSPSRGCASPACGSRTSVSWSAETRLGSGRRRTRETTPALIGRVNKDPALVATQSGTAIWPSLGGCLAQSLACPSKHFANSNTALLRRRSTATCRLAIAISRRLELDEREPDDDGKRSQLYVVAHAVQLLYANPSAETKQRPTLDGQENGG